MSTDGRLVGSPGGRLPVGMFGTVSTVGPCGFPVRPLADELLVVDELPVDEVPVEEPLPVDELPVD